MAIRLNYQNLFEIDRNPGGTADYVRIALGFASAELNNNEDIDQTAYLDGNGGKSTEVTGFQRARTFSGFWDPSDAAQAFIKGLETVAGEGRHTNFRETLANGDVFSGDATIKDIVAGSGDANAKAVFSFGVDYNGKPTKTAAVAATAPTVTFAAATTLVGGTKATITAAVGDTLYYSMGSVAKTANNRQYVDIGNLSAYTTDQEVAATAGQYFTLYELDAFRHVVKFVSHLMVTGEIKAA